MYLKYERFQFLIRKESWLVVTLSIRMDCSSDSLEVLHSHPQNCELVQFA
jgi:hypothetical protein